MGVARLHMFILSILSIGFYFALGVFQREYQKFLDCNDDGGDDKKKKSLNGGNHSSSEKNVKRSSLEGSTRRNVSKAKRED